MRWRGSWAAAQITGVILSSLVWAVLLGGWRVTGLVAILLGLAYVVGFRTRPGLWWRFGIRRPTPQQRDAVLAAMVPITALRGRNQPRVWIGCRLYGQEVIMATGLDLIVSGPMVGRILTGQLRTERVCELVSNSLGQQPVINSRMVAAGDAYCLPWNVAAVVGAEVVGRVRRVPLVWFSWRIRWIVIALAIVDAWRHERWIAVAGVAVFAVLSWSTSYLRRRWETMFARLGHTQLAATMLTRSTAEPGGDRPHPAGLLARSRAVEEAGHDGFVS